MLILSSLVAIEVAGQERTLDRGNVIRFPPAATSDNTSVVTVDSAGSETTPAAGSANIVVLARWQDVVADNYSCAAIYRQGGCWRYQ